MPPASTLSQLKGFASGLFAAVCFALMAYLVNQGAHQWTVEQLAFSRAAVGVIVLLPFVARQLGRLCKTSAAFIWSRSFFGCVSVFCFFHNLRMGTAADAKAVADTAPVFVTVFSLIALRELPDLQESLGLILVATGLLALFSPTISSLSPHGMLVGICGAISASLAYISLRRASAKFSVELIVWSFSFVTTIGAVFFINSSWKVPTAREASYLITIGVCGLLGQWFMTVAYKYLKAAIASSVSATSVVWIVLLQALYQHKGVSLASLLSYTAILAGVCVLHFAERKATGGSQSALGA